jgi:hypothetical protein
MVSISKRLDELGFGVGCIAETIVVTRNPDGALNAAPMGITRIGTKDIEIKPFKTSSTYQNLSTCRYACANITDDPYLFLVTAFKNEYIHGFEPPIIEENLSIRGADARVHVEVIDVKDFDIDRGDFICRADSIEIDRTLPTVFSRGRAMAIEGVIHATRIDENLRKGRLEEAESLIRRFDMCAEVVERVSTPDSIEYRVIGEMKRMMEKWGEAPSK